MDSTFSSKFDCHGVKRPKVRRPIPNKWVVEDHLWVTFWVRKIQENKDQEIRKTMEMDPKNAATSNRL